MKLSTFRGGTHPPDKKNYSNQKTLQKADSPKIVYISLQQHIGAPAKAIVNVGDQVKLGQKIGEQQGFVSCNVHSSVSGKVIAIKDHELPGVHGICIVIENDFKESIHEGIKPKGRLEDLTKEDIINIVRESGIVGMGGATFPTHVKISPPSGKKIDTIILNGAECEPYLTADHRLMLESSDDILFGLKVLMKALEVKRGYVAVENNKLDALKVLEKSAQKYDDIEIIGLKVKYPQGAEKQLIYSCIGREVPSGGLPMDAGAVVNNVATAAQIAKSINTGMPLIDRVTTVTGSCIKEPKNLIIKIGTLVSEIIEQCGGFRDDKEVAKIIMGGPMMGIAQYTTDIPTNKGSSGILCLDEGESKTPKQQNCLRCGRCVDVCPAFLQPLYISSYSLKNDFESAQKYRALDCIECGSCSFICPSRRLLLQSIRNAKREIISNKRK
ncbi:MAG: electron transport complex subunit RsxC [Romboutsia sp.]